MNYIRGKKEVVDLDEHYHGSYTEDDRIEARRKLMIIHENIENLAPRDLIVFKRHFDEAWSREKISANLDISLGAVDAAISRIRAYLKGLVGE